MGITRRQFLIGGATLGASCLLPVGALASGPVHTVVRGDTLSGIALRYGVTVREIQQANNLSGTVIRIDQKLQIPSGNAPAPAGGAGGSIRHTVVRGDTLGGIARRYGSTVRDIQQANNLSGTVIRINQVLTVPVRGGGPDLLSHVRADARRIRIQRDRWRTIVVHHSGIRFGNARSYDNFHRTQRRMVNGLAYHFVIGNGVDSGDGEIEIGSRWQQQLNGGHVRSAAVNENGIGICLVGNYMETHPTPQQMLAFTQLMDWLTGEILTRKPRFAGHKEIDRNHTVCPGRNFPLAQMHQRYG